MRALGASGGAGGSASARLGGDRSYEGEVIDSGNTLRNLVTVAVAVQRRDETGQRLIDGRLVHQFGVAAWQGMPTIPPAEPSAAWEAPAVIRLRLPDGRDVSLPVNVAWRADGVERYEGEDVFRLTFGYSLRWPMTEVALEAIREAGLVVDLDLPPLDVRLAGSHQGALLMPIGGGVPVLHRTDVREQITDLATSTSEERSGFFLTWYSSPAPRDGLLERVRAEAPADVEVDRDELDRLRLSIRNLLFVADRDVLLPGEGERLDGIAVLLQSVPEPTVLVTGHTADVGTVESQLSLSVARAERIVTELIARGVRPGRLRFEGVGGSEPIADNTTDTGRAANRRVEIRLLDE